MRAFTQEEKKLYKDCAESRYNMTKQEIMELIKKHKEANLKLAKEYAESYNSDKNNNIAKHLYYHNVIAYNELEAILSEIENRRQMAIFFNVPPALDDDTLKVQLQRFKADEWHYPSKGELPSNQKTLLISLKERMVLEWYKFGFWYDNDDGEIEEDVLSWLEISPPCIKKDCKK